MPTRLRAPGAGHNRSIVLDGTKVEAARKAKGWSREALLDAAKAAQRSVSLATVKRAEHGHPIYLYNASSLAIVLETTVAALAPDASGTVTPLRPTIAVLPFGARDGATELFAEGLADDLIARLCRSWFPVVARTSSLAPSTLDGRAGAKALGARYWIDGSVRRAGSNVIVTTQLVDAESGTIVTSARSEHPFTEVLKRQQALATEIVTALSPAALDHNVQQLVQHEPADLEAWQQAMLGAWHFYRRTPGDNAKARSLLTEAVRRDPHMPPAWYTLALTHQQDLINQWSEQPQRSIEVLHEIATEYERRYPDEAGAQVAGAYLDVYQGRRLSAMTRLSSAIELDPNACLAYTLYGQTLAMAHEPDRGLEQFDVALQLNPKDTERWSTHVGIALAHFVAERYAEAIAAAHDALHVRPSAAFPYSTIASAQAWLGNLPEAREALGTMLALQPTMSTQGVVSIMSSTDADIGARYLEGLRRAGLKDGGES